MKSFGLDMQGRFEVEMITGALPAWVAADEGRFIYHNPTGEGPEGNVFYYGTQSNWEPVGGTIYRFAAGEALVAGTPVYVDGAGTARKALAAGTEQQSRVFGIVRYSCNMGDNVIIFGHGRLCPIYTGLAPGTPYYLASAGGAPTTGCPTGAGTYQVQIGIARNATTIICLLHDFTARYA